MARSYEGYDWCTLSRDSLSLGWLRTSKEIKKDFIDARKFWFRPSNELVGPWRTKNISPLYNEAGVRKFAFLYPPGSPIPSANEQIMPNEKFPTAFFTSESELRKWLSD